MKNPRSDPAPGGSSSQGSGEDFARIKGRDVGGVEESAWTGEKKTRFQSTPRDLGMTAREQGLGQIEGLDWDDTMLKEDIDSYFKRYKGLPDNGDDEAWAPINDQQLKDMELRFALCRLKAHKMLKGKVLSIAELREMYPPPTLEEEGYFHWLERDFEWYFDPEYCKYAHLEDYQRLALPNTGEYLEWEYYHNTCSTLQSDRDFVYFWETLSSKTKNFLSAKSIERKRIERVVFYHAVKIAKECTHVFTTLLHSGYSEYLWSVRFDNTWCKDFACLYFEIWKLVARQKVGLLPKYTELRNLWCSFFCLLRLYLLINHRYISFFNVAYMSFKDAFDQGKEKGMRSLCRFELKAELDSDQQWRPGPITRHYNTYVAGINENLTDGDAYKFVMEAVKKFVPKLKSYYDYAKKKLDIAEKIGLIPPNHQISSM